MANLNVVTCEEEGCHSFEDILGDHVLSVDLEKEDCSIVENIAMEDLGLNLGGSESN